jgi:ring-1,2-phenylacetyl-CoA epoxidase subunit PaaE
MEQGGLYQTIRIKAIQEEVKDFKIFTFEERHPIEYTSGQYLTLVTSLDNEEIRRSYSITSSPVLNEPLSIGVKRVENGLISRLLIDNAKPGDEWITTGAGGFFVLPAHMEGIKQIFFFAAGSGITPIISLLKTTLHTSPQVFVVLIYSNASPSKAVFFKELMALKEAFAERFHVEFLFSNSANLAKARLHRDLLLELLSAYANASSGQTLYYICGPQSYMRLCTYTLQEVGIPKDAIKKENFNIESIKPALAVPPDKGIYKAYIRWRDQQYEIVVPYPESILQAAKRKKIALPYSCENGRCGNCVARCTKGKVWHSYNEVLTDKDLDNGLVLTCVGHPIGGDVELSIG